jgi:hypothetical protein
MDSYDMKITCRLDMGVKENAADALFKAHLVTVVECLRRRTSYARVGFAFTATVWVATSARGTTISCPRTGGCKPTTTLTSAPMRRKPHRNACTTYP